MNAQWKKFDGSEEQISEILNAKDGAMVRIAELKIEQLVDYLNPAYLMDRLRKGYITEYMLCIPHPHAEMIIEWARTGREVYFYNPFISEWMPCVDNKPEWAETYKYSFNPDNESSYQGKIACSSCHGDGK